MWVFCMIFISRILSILYLQIPPSIITFPYSWGMYYKIYAFICLCAYAHQHTINAIPHNWVALDIKHILWGCFHLAYFGPWPSQGPQCGYPKSPQMYCIGYNPIAADFQRPPPKIVGSRCTPTIWEGMMPRMTHKQRVNEIKLLEFPDACTLTVKVRAHAFPGSIPQPLPLIDMSSCTSNWRNTGCKNKVQCNCSKRTLVIGHP